MPFLICKHSLKLMATELVLSEYALVLAMWQKL